MMVANQIHSLFAFANALGYHVLLHRNSGKPYFKAIAPMFGTCNILDITQMQYLHNMAFFEDKLDPNTRLYINLRSSGKKMVTFECYRHQINYASIYKECSTVHLLWDKRHKRMVLNG